MKKLLLFLFVIFISFSFLSCDNRETSSSTSTTNTFTNVSTESKTTTDMTDTSPYITYNTWKADSSLGLSNYFDSSFYNPEYNPITNNLTFNLSIDDSNYKQSTYYLITRTKDAINWDNLTLFEINSSSVERFHSIEYTPGKEVVIAKSSGTIYNNFTYLEPVASLIAYDSKETERKHISNLSIRNNDVDFVEIDETPLFDIKVSLDDPDRLLTSIKVLVYCSRFNAVIDEKSIDLTSDMYDGDTLIVDHIIFNNLTPEYTYTVLVYISGNDGVESFNEVQAYYSSWRAPGLSEGSNIRKSYPGFWGVIKNIEIYDGYSKVNLTYVNIDVILIDAEYATASLVIYDSQNYVIKSYPLENGIKYVDIEDQYLNPEYSIQIVCDQDDTMLTGKSLRYDLEDILDAQYSDHKINVFFKGTDLDIQSIHLTITLSGETEPIIDMMLDVDSLEIGHNWIDIPDGPDGVLTNYEASFDITFIGYHGEETIKTGWIHR